MESENKDGILSVNKSDRYVAISDLIEDSKSNGTYYMLLILSSIIIAAGVLLANSAILIGGMLITPVLSPILLIALSISAGKPMLLKNTIVFLIKSIALIIAISFISGLIFYTPENADFYKSTLFDNSLRAAFLYFLVAFTSGIAATFSWVRKGVNNVLPGISIAVSLVPPISMVGIWLATSESELMRFFLMVFLFNLFGIIMGGLIVFSMLRFYRSGNVISDKVDQLAEEEKNNHGA